MAADTSATSADIIDNDFELHLWIYNVALPYQKAAVISWSRFMDTRFMGQFARSRGNSRCTNVRRNASEDVREPKHSAAAEAFDVGS